MSPVKLLKWAANGVPGLYRTARRTGLDRAASLRLVVGSGAALALARKRFPQRWREENGVRHFVWQAWVAAEFGLDVAQAVGRGHERVSSSAADSQVDQANNEVGQAYGDTHRDTLTGRSTSLVQRELADVATRLWDEGGLFKSDPDGQVVQSP